MKSHFVAAAAASVVAVGGLTAAVHLHSQAEGQSFGAVSGQELFQAVVFGQGELAKELGNRPVLRDFYRADYIANNGPEQIAAANQIVESITAKDPGYFAGFAEAMRSGSPYVVSDAVAAVELELQRVGLRSDTPTVPGAAASRPAPPRSPKIPKSPKGVNVNFHINFNFAINVNFGVNENAIVNTNYYKARKAAFSDPFQHDVVIGELTSVLKI